MPMPFSPCDPALAKCPDVTVGILENVFGPIVMTLVKGQDPNTATATGHILASTMGFFNSGLLVIASLIVTYVAVMGAVNTANDGEAMGKSWSAFATPLRIVAGGAVLLPTASGYSFIQMLVLMISLWGVGFANGMYKIGMTVGIMKPAGIVESSYVPGNYYGMRQFAKDYLEVAYCARQANTIYKDPLGNPMVKAGVGAGSAADRIVNQPGKTDHVFDVKDRNPVTNLAGGEPFCGTVNITTYSASATFPDDPSGTHAAMDQLRAKLMQVKLASTVSLMKDLEAWVKKWPPTMDDTAWTTVESKEFNDIIRARETEVTAAITAEMTGGATGVNTGTKKFIDGLTLEGWSMAGGIYQRIGMMRTRLAGLTAEPVGTATPPAMTGLPDDSRADDLRTSVQSVTEAITKKSEETGKGYEASTTIKPEDVASYIPKDTKSNYNVTAVTEDAGSKLSLLLNGAMKGITDVAIGSASDVDAVTRMKLTGDSIAAFRMTLFGVKLVMVTAITKLRVAAGIANSGKVLGTGFDPTGITTPLWDWYMAVPNAILTDMADYASILAFYFGVLLPSVPYTIFMITVVGWVLAVLQSVVAAPLWAIMHMRPSQTFVGSDTQGYLLLLSLFVRPALAVVGLFAAVLIADPVVDYIAKAFFAMRGDVTASTGMLGALTAFYSFFWWFTVFGLLLLPVLYMIFGLPQVLPDQVLRWIGGGLDDMGAASASGSMQGASGPAAASAAGKLSGGSSQKMMAEQTKYTKAENNRIMSANPQGASGAYGPGKISYTNKIGGAAGNPPAKISA